MSNHKEVYVCSYVFLIGFFLPSLRPWHMLWSGKNTATHTSFECPHGNDNKHLESSSV